MYQGDNEGSVPTYGHESGHAGNGLGPVRLGDYLVQQGVLSADQLAGVLDQQRARGGALLGQMLVHQGVLTEVSLATALAEIAGVPFKPLRLPMVQDAALQAMPSDIPPRHGVVPVAVVGDTLEVATADPLNILAIDEIERRTGLRVQQTCSTETDIRNAVEHFYGGAGVLENLVAETIGRHDAETQRAKSSSFLVVDETSTADEPIVRLVDEIIEQAVRRRATDIHIDPEEDSLRIRYRVDGLLQPGPVLPKKLHHSIISRLKVIAALDIAEQRLPQEGHITYRTGNREVDLRVSCFPTVFGEKMAVRVLERQMLFGGLTELGIEAETLAKLEDSMARTKGIVLLTGPTGSGKTTTLYTMLSNLDTMANNIVTLEDPVEYRLPQIRQSQINNRAGFTFATGIRSMLLVLSTLHTNEAAGTFPRLIDMGLEPYLIGSTVISAVAERLVRKVCPHCGEPAEPDAVMLEQLGLSDEQLDGSWLRGSGCHQCQDTGYLGRTGIFEILMVSDPIREAMKEQADTRAIRRVAVQEGMQTLMQHGLERVRRGETTLEELARVARE